jgi:hypothetical protein
MPEAYDTTTPFACRSDTKAKVSKWTVQAVM